MKKASKCFLTIFGVGVTCCLFAGALALIGFVVALCIGGELATQLCVFIHKTWFPWVIKLTSVCAFSGLIGMYMNKVTSLTVSASQNGDK